MRRGWARGQVAIGAGLVAVLAGGGCSDDPAATPCAFTDLASHFATEVEDLEGFDLDVARDHGWATGIEAPFALPQTAADQVPGSPGGWSDDDVTCSLGNGKDPGSTVLRAPDLPATAELPSAVAGEIDGDLIYLSNVDLTPVRDLDEQVAVLLERIEAEAPIWFEARRPAGDSGRGSRVAWYALALAPGAEDDVFDVVQVWLFDDGTSPERGADELAGVYAGDSAVRDLVTIDPATAIEVEGQVLSMRAPLKDPREWTVLTGTFDPSGAIASR